MTSNDSIFNSSYIDSTSTPSILDSIFFLNKDVNEVYLRSVEHTSFFSNWAFIFVLVLLILIATVRVSSEKHILFLLQSILNRQTATRLYRERVTNLLHPSFRLDIIYILISGLYLLHLENYFFENTLFPEWILIFINVAALLFFNGTKYMLYRISGVIFNCSEEVSEYLFYTKSANRVLGLFLFPTVVLLLFHNGIWTEILLVFGLLTTLFFNASSLYKGIRIIAQKDFSISYLILYLCSLEILPLLIVWRILWSM